MSGLRLPLITWRSLVRVQPPQLRAQYRPPGLETVKAIQGFLQFKSAEGLSVRTIESYSRDLQQWVEYQGAMDVVKVTHQQLRQYITYLLTEYVPRRLTGHNDVKLSPKTVRNVWITLSAFFPLSR